MSIDPERPKHNSYAEGGKRGGGPGLLNVMKESTKRTIKRVFDIIVTILTALITSITTTSCLG